MRRFVPLCAAVTLSTFAVGQPTQEDYIRELGNYAVAQPAQPQDKRDLQELSKDTLVRKCRKDVKACDKENPDIRECKKLAKDIPVCDANIALGAVCKLPLSQITPTQTTVGTRAATCNSIKLKKRKDTEKEGNFEDGLTRHLLESSRLVPTVIGPDYERPHGYRFYITDRHHLSYGLFLAAGKKLRDDYNVYACIIANKHEVTQDAFWSYMVKNGNAWTKNDAGDEITVDELQKVSSLDKLGDSPFRTWSAWVRDSCGYLKYDSDCLAKARCDDINMAGVKVPAPFFMEFRWAEYLAKNMPELRSLDSMKIGTKKNDEKLQRMLGDAITIVQSVNARNERQKIPGVDEPEALPGYNDPTDDLFDSTAAITFKEGCDQ